MAVKEPETKQTYIVQDNIGRHGKGTTVTADDFPPGRIEELVKAGKVTVNYDDVKDPEDVQAWKARSGRLEADMAELRKADAGAAQLGKIQDLEAENGKLKGDLKTVSDMLAELQMGTVPKAQVKNLQDRYDQLDLLHKSTVAELAAEKAKKEK